MKSTAQQPEDLRRRRSEAIVEEHIHALFRRIPMLVGFSLRQDLEVADVAFDTWPGYGVSPQVYEELVQALADLAEERPEAVELLRGRTFARAFH
jgi:hypothetical protein